MPVRVRYKTEVFISSSMAGEEDLGKPIAYITNDLMGEGGTWKTTLVAGAVDQQLFLPNVASARFIWLRTNAKDPTQTLTGILVRRNLVTNEQFPVDPLPGAKEAQWMQTTSALTALFASNPSVIDIEVTIGVAGD